MKTFKEFLDEMEGGDSVPANNIAHTGATAIAKYDPLLGTGKMFRRKKKKKEMKQL